MESQAGAEASPRNDCLFGAAECGDNTHVERLIGKGADVNAAESEGLTALQVAAGGGHQAVVDTLLGNGADISARGPTALLAAIDGGHQVVFETLLNNSQQRC